MTRQKAFIRQFTVILCLMLAMGTLTIDAGAYTLQEEIDLGKKIDTEILKQEPQITNQAALKEINDVGMRIVKNGDLKRPDLPYSFKIIRGEDLNAFSTPGGYIYFTEHMWNILRPDERAGVLAHEIVHADRRHALDAMLKAQKRSLILGGLLIIAGANRTAANVADLANQLYTLKYSRGDERQADEVGTLYLKNAGLNPAGLLMSMRKIRRFEDEAGDRQPTILASHPATPDRERYLEQTLRTMGIAVPPDTVKDIPSPDQIGSVSALNGNKMEFTSTKPLRPGDTVWLMGKGWDYYYENRTAVPAARAVVISAKSAYSATIYPLVTAKPKDLAKGAPVYMPQAPQQAAGAARLSSAAADTSGIARLTGAAKAKKFERFIAASTVWDPRNAKLISDNVGYVVVTDPANPTGYVAAVRPKYSYAPPSAGAELVSVSDPDAARWVGPIISIGKSGGTIEILPNRSLDPNKTYNVVTPDWDKKEPYKNRIIGAAKPGSSDRKIILKMTEYYPGSSIDDIQAGFDVYEETPEEPKK